MIENLDLKPNLAKAVIAVMKAVDNVEKGMTVGTGGSSYKGVGDKDVKLVYKKAMSDNGLCILPIDVDPKTTVDRWEETNQYGTKTKQSVFTEVKTKYLLLHESGESVILAGYGQGVDSQDKGAGKATTYSLKYTLLYTFLTPTGDIDDSDKTHSEAVTTPSVKSEKAWLNESDEAYTKVVDALKNKKATISQVVSKYKLSKEVRAKLESLVK